MRQRASRPLSHKEAGLDFIIAQGTEGGGHTGEIGSIVLWPEVIEAVAPIPVLAAGGIGSGKQMAAAMALGAQGVWTGSIWLTVSEADTPPAQKESYLKATSRDTVRSRSWTGKPCRMLRNDWTEAWEKPENPKPLGMPLQFMVTAEAVSRGHHYATKAQPVGFNPVGQIVGRMNEIRSTRRVIEDMVQEYIEATERLQVAAALGLISGPGEGARRRRALAGLILPPAGRARGLFARRRRPAPPRPADRIPSRSRETTRRNSTPAACVFAAASTSTPRIPTSAACRAWSSRPTDRPSSRSPTSRTG